MKKSPRIIAALLSLIILISLAACNSDSSHAGESSDTTQTSVNQSAPAESEEVTGSDNESQENVTVAEDTEATGTAAEGTPAEGTAAEGTETENTETTETVTENTETELGEFEIDEFYEGEAYVITPYGLKYTATDYSKIEENAFVFDSAVTFDLGDAFSDVFNRFSVNYSSTAPVKLYLSYTVGKDAREDLFYLEKGEGIFSALVPDFFESSTGSKRGHHITSIRIVPCIEGEISFVFSNFDSERIEVPDRNLYFKGSRLTLGVDLMWGGALTYVSDSSCPVDGLGNLINIHDEGRLVQQSYYGTGAIPGVFEWGCFNGSDHWPYNPVQGGGQGGISSHLIDFYVGDNYIYVKSQPMDWGKVGYLTPSYMENWYYVEDDYIRVTNRFVDFSGWEHPENGQEIPAFYTVSYLDSFALYDGVNPWTNDELTYRHSLPFWGDSQNSSQCTFPIKEPNSETWCAWFNENDNYGIGIYVPGADKYSAGRYKYDGSKAPDANPTNYVAPWKQIKLVAYEALEYDYLITTGSLDEIRAIFKANKDIITNTKLTEKGNNNRQPYFEESLEVIDLTKPENTKYVLYPSSTSVTYDESEGAVKLTVTGVDPHVSFDYLASKYPLDAKDFEYLEIEYMLPADNNTESYSGQLFICADNRTAAAESDSVRYQLIKDGKYHTLRIKLSTLSFWKGRINLIRFDYFNASPKGDMIYLRSVALTNQAAESTDMRNVVFDSESKLDLMAGQYRTGVSYDARIGAAKLVALGDDPSVTVDYDVSSEPLNAENFKTLKITYMMPKTGDYDIYPYAIFPCSGNILNPTAEATIYQLHGIIADGEWHTLEIDMSQYSFWSGEIHKIRFDYLNSGFRVGDVFYLKSIVLE